MRSLTHLKNKAVALRLNGCSYNTIRKELGIKSKGTLSYWFSDLILPKESKRKLERNIGLAQKRGLLEFNKSRTGKIKKENLNAHREGWAMIKSLSLNDLLLIGTCLYWGEGTKAENRHSNLSLAFSNSDPEMVMVFIKFLRKIFLVHEDKIRAGIYIYPSISENSAKKFWAKVTGLPTKRFYIIRQISRASQSKRVFNRLPYGTVVIKVNNRLLFFKMKGMIKGIAHQFRMFRS